LDWLMTSDEPDIDDHAWRTWVDEVDASWAACLLTDPALAELAVTALSGSDHAAGTPADFRRLTSPGEQDLSAAPLLRHPDLLTSVTELYREDLVQRLEADPVEAA
jgi:hypothetical protein